MTIKSKVLDKFYIEQYIINDFRDWLDKNYNKLTDKNYIIGYMFFKTEGKFGQNANTFNVYLINKDHYIGKTYTSGDLIQSWKSFLLTQQRVFKNPPIEQWMNTKQEWCKKLANRLTKSFDKSYNEILSDVYYVIMKAYNKGTVYMGCLDYLEKAVKNSLLIEIRDKKTDHLDNGVSLDIEVGKGVDDEPLTIADMVAYDDSYDEDRLEYKELLNDVTNLLSNKFSKREIEQLINQDLRLLPRNLKQRLYKWRQEHDIKEIL